MADEPNEEGEVLELTEADQVEPEAEVESQPESDDEEVVVSFGEEAAPASEEDGTEWVRNLRKQYREVVRERDELKRQVTVPQSVEVGPEPTLEDCDFDGELLKTRTREWDARKAKAEAAKTEAQKAEARVREELEAQVGVYGEDKQSLGVKDFDEAEAEVLSSLNDAQKLALIRGTKGKAATLVYALGKHPDRLRQIASIADPIEFAFAAGQLEREAKVQRRPRTAPESEVRGSAPLTGQGDKRLERLEAEAERTGNRTKVIEYKRKLKAKGR